MTGAVSTSESCMLLAIDTAIGTSVALGAQNRVTVVSSDDARGHAEAIGPLIAAVFERGGVSSAAVTGVVVGVGPGPFTGLRIGIAAAHAFALARGVPVMPLHGHEAVALDAFEPGSGGAPGVGSRAVFAPVVRVVQDARRRELFVTDYAGLDADGIPIRTAGPGLVARADYAPAPGELWPERIPAARLVHLAARRLTAGRGFEPHRALYLRAPDAKRPGEPKRTLG